MSGFNGSGVFSISGSGQPYVAGTVISAAVVNTLNTDLATGLSTCMLKDGTQTATAGIGFYAGTVSLPGIYFGTDTATGFYRIGLNNNGYAVNGTKLLDMTGTTLAVTSTITANTIGVTSGTTATVFNTTATTVNAFGAATAVNMGAGAASTLTASFTTAVALNTAAITSNQTTVALINTNATTLNFAGAATTLNIGNSGGTTTALGNWSIGGTLASGALTVTGTSANPATFTQTAGGTRPLYIYTDATYCGISDTSGASDSYLLFLANSTVLAVNNTVRLTATTSGVDVTGAISATTNFLSDTAFATPSALSATGLRAFASTVSGAALMGFGTTNDVSLMNRAGTVCLGVGPNTTVVNVPGSLLVTGAITNSALTSGRLPIIGTAGLLDSSATYTYSNASNVKQISVSGSGSTYTQLSAVNTHATGDARIFAQADGGDAVYVMTVTTQDWSIGIDNSVSNRLTISASDAFGVGDAVYISTAGVVTIPSLAGSGTRTVVVDANGVLSAP